MTSMESNNAGLTAARKINLHGHRISHRAAGNGPLLALIHGIAGSSVWTSFLEACPRMDSSPAKMDGRASVSRRKQLELNTPMGRAVHVAADVVQEVSAQRMVDESPELAVEETVQGQTDFIGRRRQQFERHLREEFPRDLRCRILCRRRRDTGDRHSKRNSDCQQGGKW
jgi:hypothetical protein